VIHEQTKRQGYVGRLLVDKALDTGEAASELFCDLLFRNETPCSLNARALVRPTLFSWHPCHGHIFRLSWPFHMPTRGAQWGQNASVSPVHTPESGVLQSAGIPPNVLSRCGCLSCVLSDGHDDSESEQEALPPCPTAANTKYSNHGTSVQLLAPERGWLHRAEYLPDEREP